MPDSTGLSNDGLSNLPAGRLNSPDSFVIRTFWVRLVASQNFSDSERKEVITSFVLFLMASGVGSLHVLIDEAITANANQPPIRCQLDFWVFAQDPSRLPDHEAKHNDDETENTDQHTTSNIH